jgi:AraC family transcriptional regulator
MSTVSLTTADRQRVASSVSSFQLRGLEVSRVALPERSAFDFSWKGQAHYLAYHHIQLRDGELHTDAIRPVRRLDLRGTLTYMPAGSSIWGWSQLTAVPAAFTAVYLKPHEMGEELGHRFAISQPSPAVYFHDPALVATMVKLHRCLSGDSPDRLRVETLCMLAVLELLGRKGAEKVETPHRGGLTFAQAGRVKEFIAANLGSDIGLGDLANSVGLSRYHFLRAFRITTGVTPYRYLLEKRVERGREILEQGGGVEEAARRLGFADSTSFARVFKRLTGVSPRIIAGQ